jgi:hypothetical protein
LIGPRDAGGNLVPGTVYTQAQPFMLWVASSLPHAPYKPPVAVEDRFHLLPDYLFGESAAMPGTPRFPFGDPLYAGAFDYLLEKNFAGFYGNAWWADDAIRHIRSFLEGIQVWDPPGTTAVSLWERTVFMLTADHGVNLPRSKRNFTENGYRSVLVIHDARLSASTDEPRVEQELTHSIDVLPTILDFAEHPLPPTPGLSLEPYLTAMPPAAPLRDLMCGHQTKSTKARTDRFVRTRPGALGRCAPSSGGSACTTDGACAPSVCIEGVCATGTNCLEDDDCAGGETCQYKTQKWCRFGRHPIDEVAGIAPVDQQPTVPCATEADCVADCPSSDPLYCTCEYREIKLYVLAYGESRLMDLFVDPDEPAMDNRLRDSGQPGDLPVGAGAPHAHVAQRLRCCLDRWWTPPPTEQGVVLGDPGCTPCEANYACHRCGNGIVDSAEQCDGTNLAGNTCASLPGGFGGGALACTGSCTFDTSGCTP